MHTTAYATRYAEYTSPHKYRMIPDNKPQLKSNLFEILDKATVDDEKGKGLCTLNKETSRTKRAGVLQDALKIELGYPIHAFIPLSNPKQSLSRGRSYGRLHRNVKLIYSSLLYPPFL